MCPRNSVRGRNTKPHLSVWQRLGIPFWQILFFSPPSPQQPFTFLFFLTSSRCESKYCDRIWRLHKRATIARGRVVCLFSISQSCAEGGIGERVVISKRAELAAAGQDANTVEARGAFSYLLKLLEWNQCRTRAELMPKVDWELNWPDSYQVGHDQQYDWFRLLYQAHFMFPVFVQSLKVQLQSSRHENIKHSLCCWRTQWQGSEPWRRTSKQNNQEITYLFSRFILLESENASFCHTVVDLHQSVTVSAEPFKLSPQIPASSYSDQKDNF